MTLAEFTTIVESQPEGVVLLEGRRAISAEDAAFATRFAKTIAIRFPRLRFRSGNAEGSDHAFSQGIALVDASRLQVIAPYPSHRKSLRYPDATYDSPDTLSIVQEDQVACRTAAASPQNRALIAKRHKKGPLAAKAVYPIRDTMKVIGHSQAFPKPICALLFVSLDDPMAGGTGHTIRVCLQEGVPFVFQHDWQKWQKAKRSGIRESQGGRRQRGSHGISVGKPGSGDRLQATGRVAESIQVLQALQIGSRRQARARKRIRQSDLNTDYLHGGAAAKWRTRTFYHGWHG